jgi:hypothetical protein
MVTISTVNSLIISIVFNHTVIMLDSAHHRRYILKLYYVSEAKSASIIRYKRGEDPAQLGPLDRASLNHCVLSNGLD